MLGCVGAWVLGCVGAWVRGCLGAWVLGCVGAWVGGCAWHHGIMAQRAGEGGEAVTSPSVSPSRQPLANPSITITITPRQPPFQLSITTTFPTLSASFHLFPSLSTPFNPFQPPPPLIFRSVRDSRLFRTWGGELAGREELADDVVAIARVDTDLELVPPTPDELPPDRLNTLLQQAVAFQMHFSR